MISDEEHGQIQGILDELLQERYRQDGDPFNYDILHDDVLSFHDWMFRIVDWTHQAVRAEAVFTLNRKDSLGRRRKALIELATICVAAVASQDRQWDKP